MYVYLYAALLATCPDRLYEEREFAGSLSYWSQGRFLMLWLLDGCGAA